MMIFMYAVLVILIILGLGSLITAAFAKDFILMIIGILLIAASGLILAELNKMQRDPFKE